MILSMVMPSSSIINSFCGYFALNCRSIRSMVYCDNRDSCLITSMSPASRRKCLGCRGRICSSKTFDVEEFSDFGEGESDIVSPFRVQEVNSFSGNLLVVVRYDPRRTNFLIGFWCEVGSDAEG